MRKHHRIHTKKPGLPPGTLISSGFDPAVKATIHITCFNEDSFREYELSSAAELDALPLTDTTCTWIELIGVDLDTMHHLGQIFSIHRLVLEDMLNTNHRPKVEDYGDYLFLLSKSIRQSAPDLYIEQFSLVIGKNYIISFSEMPSNLFEPIRKRLRPPQSKFRSYGTDYLAYALLDIIVDNYFTALEHAGDQLDLLEEQVLLAADPAQIRQIQSLRTDLLFIRRAIWPLRDVLSTLERIDSQLIHPRTRLYYRDISDHIVQIIDAVETFREIVNGLMDIYLSSISNHMNEIMKVLTIISTIFIPLTFLAGIEGMNFKFMPELDWPYGYPALLLFMALISVMMLRFFKKKQWL